VRLYKLKTEAELAKAPKKGGRRPILTDAHVLLLANWMKARQAARQVVSREEAAIKVVY